MRGIGSHRKHACHDVEKPAHLVEDAALQDEAPHNPFHKPAARSAHAHPCIATGPNARKALQTTYPRASKKPYPSQMITSIPNSKLFVSIATTEMSILLSHPRTKSQVGVTKVCRTHAREAERWQDAPGSDAQTYVDVLVQHVVRGAPLVERVGAHAVGREGGAEETAEQTISETTLWSAFPFDDARTGEDLGRAVARGGKVE